ncbi:MAG: N-formylglutamate amidohydrolase [Rhodobacteraceae bacterium]|nr:N-formylglutamate amidohydrolase [Paracoccaceae bacterium]
MNSTAYDLYLPDRLMSPLVFASPHSGRHYPRSFLQHSVLDARTIRSSEDAFVDRLFDCTPQFGAPLIAARAPRAFVDMNRSPDEVDSALIEGTRRLDHHNPRVASGLGVVPRVVSNGRAIYNGEIPMAEVRRRINIYWHPYHRSLKQLLTRAHEAFGEAVLLDCHSMPHEAIDSTVLGCRHSPEIVLGDRFGAAASGDIMDCVESAFASAGFKVVRNVPFAGAYVAQAYGRPSRCQHVIQIEIDRSLYMDERLIEPHQDFETFRARLRGVIAELIEIGREHKLLAAE